MNEILNHIDKKISDEEKLNENKKLIHQNNFEINDWVYYLEDLNRERPYLLLNTPDLVLMKTENGWGNAYIYSGEDKKTGKQKYLFVKKKILKTNSLKFNLRSNK